MALALAWAIWVGVHRIGEERELRSQTEAILSFERAAHRRTAAELEAYRQRALEAERAAAELETRSAVVVAQAASLRRRIVAKPTMELSDEIRNHLRSIDALALGLQRLEATD